MTDEREDELIRALAQTMDEAAKKYVVGAAGHSVINAGHWNLGWPGIARDVLRELRRRGLLKDL